MGRPRDGFWNYVQTIDSVLKCIFCGFEFAFATSISRIKLHLCGVKGVGITSCLVVPSDVQKAAYMAVRRRNMKLKNIPRSSNDEVSDPSVTSSQKHANEVENGVQDVERVPTEVQNLEAEEEVEGGKAEASLRKEDLVQSQHETPKSFLEKGKTYDTLETSAAALVTTKLVGEVFVRNMELIWSCLMKDEVLSIGVYGMGGVGKTTLLTHIHNQLLERPDIFHHVCWITVSKNYSIYELQNRVARSIFLDLSFEDDERKRAAKLSNALIHKRKSVLILDDLWYGFPLEDVGIPVGVNGCKFILTTRLLDVCQMMACQEIIKVEPLSEKEAWTLFVDKLGNYNMNVEHLAKAVVKECGGLPLAIRTLAGSMRGLDDVHEWRNALRELKESNFWQYELVVEVFRILKFSFHHLNDSALQHCFLYCALFPENYMISREDLIEYWIDEGIIGGMKSRQEKFDKGHAMLNRLVSSCLLESSIGADNYRFVKMHNLMRDMALQILRENSPVMVEAGAQLTELPDEEKWTEDLVKISLIENNIKEIHSNLSPRCPKLATLLLCKNHELELIPDSFLNQLHNLKVLDLSYTAVKKLPTSISNLVCLNALSLRWCWNLRFLPSLAKLTALKKLDLSYSGLQKVPQGMESLSNLWYLSLSGTRTKDFPAGLLPKFSHLRCLNLGWPFPSMMTVGEEVACLRKLENLEFHFCDLNDFGMYLRSQEGRQPLSSYNLLIGPVDYSILSLEEHVYRNSYLPLEIGKEVWLYSCSVRSRQDFLLLPVDIQHLVIARCDDARSLSDVSSFKNATELKSISVCDCSGMKYLLRLSPDILDCLENLQLLFLGNLHDLFSREATASLSLQHNGIFSHLKTIVMSQCSRMKKLFPSGLLPNLKNLEIIEVSYCEKMKEIISMEEQEEDDIMSEESNYIRGNRLSVEFDLPKLRILSLKYLPELKSICCGKMICDSLQEITLWNCWKLKRVPLSLPLPSLKKIYIDKKEWWESVKWDHPNTNNVLLPLCHFCESSKGTV